MTTSIKVKLLAASLLLLLAALSHGSGVSAALVARVVLGAAALGGLALWMVRARRLGGGAGSGAGSARARPFQLPAQLSIAARTGLSARTGLALVEADGQRFLVAYGDGFAQLLDAVPFRPSPRRARKGGRP